MVKYTNAFIDAIISPILFLEGNMIPIGEAAETYGLIKKILPVHRFKSIDTTPTKISDIIKNSICEFQLDYTNYQFKASILHKDFKKHVYEKNNTSARASKGNLDGWINSNIKLSCQSLANGLRNYFASTRDAYCLPRVGFHAIDPSGIISPLFITDDSTEFKENHYSEYSPFEEIINDGTPYLDNNIPKTAVKIKSYKHKGLDIDRIRSEYKCINKSIINMRPISRWRRPSENYIDPEWNDISPKYKKDGHKAYKSHLIIPITFRGHGGKISSELVNVLRLRDDGRSILGFVAIDHPTTYYFSTDAIGPKNIDINVAYIFADMLSLVRITEFMYTTGSSAYMNFNSEE